MQPIHDNGLSKGKDLEADLLSELEGQTLEALCKARRHQRYEVQTIVVLAPGNSSARADELRGTTADVSRSGCHAEGRSVRAWAPPRSSQRSAFSSGQEPEAAPEFLNGGQDLRP